MDPPKNGLWVSARPSPGSALPAPALRSPFLFPARSPEGSSTSTRHSRSGRDSIHRHLSWYHHPEGEDRRDFLGVLSRQHTQRRLCPFAEARHRPPFLTESLRNRRSKVESKLPDWCSVTHAVSPRTKPETRHAGLTTDCPSVPCRTESPRATRSVTVPRYVGARGILSASTQRVGQVLYDRCGRTRP
ncbi:hypothetical protein AGIG_G937 [Arapaima gigas]